MKLFVHLLINSIAIILLGEVLPRLQVGTFTTAILFACILGLLNTFIRPILKFISFPISILTLGLFSFIIDAFLVLIADGFLTGFSSGGFINALIVGVVFSLTSLLFKD